MVIPFSYFFYEEYGEDITFGRRLWAGFKYTAFFMVIIVAIFIIGLFVKGDNPDLPSGSDKDAEYYKKWITDVIDTQNGIYHIETAFLFYPPASESLSSGLFYLSSTAGEGVMNFAFACAGLIGLITWLIFTVSLLPFFFFFLAHPVPLKMVYNHLLL